MVGRGNAGLTLYAFLYGNRTVRRPARVPRVPKPPEPLGPRWAGSTLTEAAMDVGGGAHTGKEEREAEGQRRIGKQGGRVAPSQRRTINHQGNSIDGSLLFEGASDACQTYLVRRTTCEKTHSFLHFIPSVARFSYRGEVQAN